MNNPSFLRKSVYSALAFFGTLIVLSVGYAAYTTMTPVISGQSLTKDLWNGMVINTNDLNDRVSKFSFLGNNIGIGITNPSDTLSVSGSVTATRFTTSTAWTTVPSNATWTTAMTCRRVGSFLQFNGYLALTSGLTTSGWPISTFPSIPSTCLPSANVAYISGTCWTNGGVNSPCFVFITTWGAMTVYANNSFTNITFAGSYPAD